MELFRDKSFNLLRDIIEPAVKQTFYGGNGGGGGAASTSTYPDYIMAVHADLLANTDEAGAGHDTVSSSMVDIVENMITGTTPYTDINRPEAAKAYDPDNAISSIESRLSTYETAVGTISTSSWDTFIDDAIAKIVAQLTAISQNISAPGSEIAAPSSEIPTPVSGDIPTPGSDIFTDFSTAVASAIAGLPSVLDATNDETHLTAQATAFENRRKGQFQRDSAIWAAGMADIGATLTSAYAIGMAMRQEEFQKAVDDFDADNRARNYQARRDAYLGILSQSIATHLNEKLARYGFYYNDKSLERRDFYRDVSNRHDKYWMDAIQTHQAYYSENELVQRLKLTREESLVKTATLAAETILKLLVSRVGNYGQAAQLAAQIFSTKIQAKQNQAEWNLEMDVEEALWDVKAFSYAGNLLASAAGGVQRHPVKPTKGQAILGGALAGASIGSTVPGIGTVAGGIIGGVGGFLLGLG
jgi:type II secretory pathway component PulJ